MHVSVTFFGTVCKQIPFICFFSMADAIVFFKDLDADLLVIFQRGLGQVVSISELMHVALLPLYVNRPLIDSPLYID
mgnify:CR=1 FL=1